MAFDLDSFVRRVRDRTGLELPQASAAVTTTLAAIGRHVSADALALLVDALPDALGEHVRRGSGRSGAADFLADVAAHEHVTIGFAREHAQVVCETLASLVDAPTRDRIAARLPPTIAAWFVAYEPAPERPPRAAPRGDRSLAGGRPGSDHPLSEAGSPPGQSGSPAATTDPHVDRRLSSTPGVAAERERRTIAEGRPGSRRPVSEGRE